MTLEITGDDWLVPRALCSAEGHFLPTEMSVKAVCTMIATEVQRKLGSGQPMREFRPRLEQSVRRHVMSPSRREGRMRQRLVNYAFIGTREQAIDHFVWCLRAYDWRAYEIEMAMCAARSTIVDFSVNRGIELMLEITKHALYPDPSMVRHYDWLGKLSDLAQGTRKVYFTYLPEKPSFRWLIMLGRKRGFKRSVVLLHDLLQIAWDSFTGPASSRPLAAQIQAQTGPMELEDVTGSTMFTASEYLRSLGLPVEAGPSMTTVRFCQINNLREKVKSLSHPFVEAPLNKFERQCLVWGIFSYWALFYQKSFGVAHNFQFVNNSAEHLGCGLAPVNSYPSIAYVKQTLGTAWSDADDRVLELWLEALNNGIDQSTVLADDRQTVVG